MIELQDTVIVNAPRDMVWAWLEALPEHYLEWHPDHISCRWLSVGAFAPAARMEVVELLHGKKHRLRLKLTGVDPGRSVDYQIFPGLKGRFEVKAGASGTVVTATIRMGVNTPILGEAIDALLRLTVGRRIDLIRKHQAEEGVNLKELLEGTARPPDPARRVQRSA